MPPEGRERHDLVAPALKRRDAHKKSSMMTFQDAKINLGHVAAVYAPAIIRAIQQEYPNQMQHVITGPEDRPTPRELHPAFYGCFDWHSSVHMHWALIRLLRLAPEAFDRAAALAVLDAHLSEAALSQEARYLLARRSFERPYGWGWALTLAHELAFWEDEPAQRWLSALHPLADAITELFLEWLPKVLYPIRVGVHGNSAFGLARSARWARYRANRGDDRLLSTITQAAIRWYGKDQDYPAHYEPGGSDFLSPAFTEVELMSLVLDRDAFLSWLDRFLPGLAEGKPASLFEPVQVSDPTDGQLAHLHGLNLYRAFVWKHLSEILPLNDRRKVQMRAAAVIHARASMDAVVGSGYMVEHWLASYAVLYLSSA